MPQRRQVRRSTYGDENGRAHDDGRADDGQCGWDRVEENPLEDRSEDDLDIDSQSPSTDGLALQTHGQQRLQGVSEWRYD